MQIMIGLGLVLAMAAVVAWNVSKKVVSLGFFVLYFLCGAGLIAAGSVLLTGQPLPIPAIVGGGIAFAYLVKLVRKRVMRVVGILTVVGVLQVFALLLAPDHKAPVTTKPAAKVTSTHK